MIQFLFWMVIAIILITAGGAFHIGYHFGRQDHPRPRPATPSWPSPATEDD
jgi:hypothetical protein